MPTGSKKAGSVRIAPRRTTNPNPIEEVGNDNQEDPEDEDTEEHNNSQNQSLFISTFELRSWIAFWLDSLEQRKHLERIEISNSILELTKMCITFVTEVSLYSREAEPQIWENSLNSEISHKNV